MSGIVQVYNRQRKYRLELSKLRSFANAALPICLKYPGQDRVVLPSLEEVEISLVSDRVIAQVHIDFMNVPGATDVITFDHGEIVISVETAERYAVQYGHSTEEEVRVYVVHGLLHLNGHEDASESGAKMMAKLQDQIVAQLVMQGAG